MAQHLIIIFLLLQFGFSHAQDSLLVGKSYLEDQIYLSVTFNNLINKTSSIQQKGLPVGLHTGFIKDIPFNEERNFGLGIGLGYDYDKFQANFIPSDEGNFVILNESFLKNKLELHGISIPLEIRYRTSTATRYKFWRLYAGGKLSYIFASKNVYKDETETSRIHNLKTLNKFQYGPYFSLGYNTWNFYGYWNLNPIFKDVPHNDNFNPNELSYIKLGMQFYIF
jgi:hypothetical protein